MKIFLAVFCLIALSQARPQLHELNDYTYEQFVAEYKKTYGFGELEYNLRKEIFENNLAMIKAHNADPTQTWTMNVNKFADMTKEEMKRFRKGKLSLGSNA